MDINPNESDLVPKPSTLDSKKKPTKLLLALGFVGVILGVFFRQPLFEIFYPKPPAPPPTFFHLPPSPAVLAKPHLSYADKDCERIIEEHIKAIDAFFLDVKKNSSKFADEALGYGSKFRLMLDYLPYTKGGRHEAFIKRKFEEYIFSPNQIEVVIKQVVSSYFKEVDSIENEMLVNIQADAANYPGSYKDFKLDESMLRVAFEDALKQVQTNTKIGLDLKLASELGSIIVAEIAVNVIRKLATSSGILGAGGLGVPATFGLSVIAGLIVDQIVSYVWDWFADPKGNLTNIVNTKLDEINRKMVDELRIKLKELAMSRAEQRQSAVLLLLQPQK